MMADFYTDRYDVIGEALRGFDPGIRRTGPAAWQAVLYNGAPLPVTARLDAEWLRLDAPLDVFAARKHLAKILSWNARLGGLAKFAVAAPDGALHLRAEIFYRRDGELKKRLSDTGDGFRAASALLHGETLHGETFDAAGGTHADELLKDPVCEPIALCRAAGWAAAERAGAAVVELEAGAQAVVEARAAGLRVRSELARTNRYSDISREALGMLLLTANGIVRMARAAADDETDDPGEAGEAGRSGVRLEVGFSSEPSPEELFSALSAIGVASRLLRREAEVLQIEDVARRYLASQTGVRLLRAASSPGRSNGPDKSNGGQ